MSTNKSLKHLKFKDRFLIANVSNYFEKHSGRDSSSYIQQTGQATWVSRTYEMNYEKPVHFRRCNVQNGGQYKLVRLSETMRRSFTPTAISFRPSTISYQS